MFGLFKTKQMILPPILSPIKAQRKITVQPWNVCSFSNRFLLAVTYLSKHHGFWALQGTPLCRTTWEEPLSPAAFPSARLRSSRKPRRHPPGSRPVGEIVANLLLTPQTARNKEASGRTAGAEHAYDVVIAAYNDDTLMERNKCDHHFGAESVCLAHLSFRLMAKWLVVKHNPSYSAQHKTHQRS